MYSMPFGGNWVIAFMKVSLKVAEKGMYVYEF